MSQFDSEPGQVFEELLREWRDAKEALIGEYSIDITADKEEADRQMEAWRDRFRGAMATVTEI